MQSLLCNPLRCVCLILLTISFLAEGTSLRHEQPFPAPCDQLEETSHRERCARFLADRETVGCQTFSNATTVASHAQLKAEIERQDYGDGFILLVTRNFDIAEMGRPMMVNGTVAIVGDPDSQPRVSIIGQNDSEVVIGLVNTARPSTFICWGIEWELSRRKVAVSAGQPGYGAIRITHSVFRIREGITENESPAYHRYLYFHMAKHPGWNINSVLVAHNQFYTVPNAFLHRYEASDVYVECYRYTYFGSGETSICDQLGEVVIRDNTWHGDSLYEVPDKRYTAIELRNIPRATVSGNRAASSNAVLSIYINFNYPLDTGAPSFDNLHLQLVNNSALPGMLEQQRRLHFDSEITESGYPLAGVVEMLCNPGFDIMRGGSFAGTEASNLSITWGNHYCSGLAERLSQNSAQCEQTTTTTTIDNTDVVVNQGNDWGSCHNQGRYFTSIWALGASTASLAAVSWELFWSLVYHYTSGKTQMAVNVMALCIPGCLHRTKKPLPLPEKN